MEVYVPMSADIIHPGHINLLREASTYGNVTVGLNSDDAIKDKKGQKPVMSQDERAKVIKAIRYVDDVVLQEEASYLGNIRKYKPSHVVHGDDWNKEIVAEVSRALAEYGGKLILVPYNLDGTENVSSSKIKARIRKQ